MRRLLLSLAYSNLWIALTASGCAYSTQVLLGLPPDWRAPWLCFASMFAVYSFAKTARFDPVADAINDPERTAFLKRWRGGLLGLCALTTGLGLFHAWRWDVVGLFVWPLATAIAYDVKFLPPKWRYRRLKDITGVKSLVVAITWAVLTVCMPVSLSGSSASPTSVALVLVWLGLLWFVNTVYFDIGDMQGDRLEGVLTVPLWLGRLNTLALLGALNLLSVQVLWWGMRAGYLTAAAGPTNLVGLLVFACLWLAADPDRDLGFVCDIVVDGMGIVAGVLAWLWVLTGS